MWRLKLIFFGSLNFINIFEKYFFSQDSSCPLTPNTGEGGGAMTQVRLPGLQWSLRFLSCGLEKEMFSLWNLFFHCFDNLEAKWIKLYVKSKIVS